MLMHKLITIKAHHFVFLMSEIDNISFKDVSV